MVENRDVLEIKIVQSGEITRFELSDKMLNRKLKDILLPLLRDLRLKEKDVFLSIDSGRMLGDYHLNLPIRIIVEQFGTKLNLYSEKIL